MTSRLPAKGSVPTVIASFIIMLSLGGIYSWSIIAPELQNDYHWSAVQTQLIFGILIAVFPSTMIITGKLLKWLSVRLLSILAAVFFSTGYLLSGFSGGNFYIILFGIGILAGIGTGIGYLIALTLPVRWYPHKKGLVTGIASAGFGLAAVILTYIIKESLTHSIDVLEIFRLIGWGYGGVLVLAAFFIQSPEAAPFAAVFNLKDALRTKHFFKLFSGIFFGTFAGLLVLGNLSSIGAEHGVDSIILMIGVSVFALANFTGRLSWGWVSDYFPAWVCITVALLFQASGIFLLGYLTLTSVSYLLLSAMIGFGFGSNFVLFAKDTAHYFGVDHLSSIYPYVFMGYALAGIAGPLTGGYMYDSTGSFHYASYTAAVMSMLGAMIFLLGKKK